jgi:hypothetical protein
MSRQAITALLTQLEERPETVQFDAVQQLIADHYHYRPTAFDNGIGADLVHNPAGQNEGSCRIFSFARAQGLNPQQTLHCFGHFYRERVLGNPDGSDHANIRTFMRHGWAGVRFAGEALRPR